MSTNVSPALRKLITDIATGPVAAEHGQFLSFPIADGRTVTIYHNDGRFEYGYTGRSGEFHGQHSTIKALRRAAA